jgi:hypothetical protein
VNTHTTNLVIIVLAVLGGIALLGLTGLSYFGSVDDSTRAILGNVAIGVVGAIAGILSQRGEAGS